MSNLYDRRRTWKIAFLIVSVLSAGIFLYISNRLVADLGRQERARMEIWAEATKRLATAPVSIPATGGQAGMSDIDFLLGIIEDNRNIPVLLVDDSGNILQYRNFRLPEAVDSLNPYRLSDRNLRFLKSKIEKLRNTENHIPIVINGNVTQHLYYEDSTLLKRLSYYPYVQLGVMIVFVAIVYFAVISTKKAEQNKVWVGLSKETAHQLGTPISSLMAWTQMLEATGTDKEIVNDINKDVTRLSVIADRFSKIGSKPEMKCADLNHAVNLGLEYMRARISSNVVLKFNLSGHDCLVYLCQPLFEWVMENLTKNAVDAMQGKGILTVTVGRDHNRAWVEVSDTGKGIARKNFKTVFNPGFTTKNRGWGLGLTLAKRIIEEYHGGRIFVKNSELGIGTTFRIELPTAK